MYYDFGMMDELQPNVKSGFRTFCKALFKGGPMIPERDLALNAKLLVDGVEEAGVLASNADRLAVEKLARYFMRQFKDTQLGKKGSGIKEVRSGEERKMRARREERSDDTSVQLLLCDSLCSSLSLSRR